MAVQADSRRTRAVAVRATVTIEGDSGRLMTSDTTILCCTLVFCEEGRQDGIAGVTPNLPV